MDETDDDNNNSDTVVVHDVDVVEDETTLATVMPIFPPKPDCFVTLLTTDDFLPGVQTLLYSIKKTSLPPVTTILYPPELVVLVTPNISQRTRSTLYPAFCTRIVEVEPIHYNDNGNTSNDLTRKTKTHVDSWMNGGALTKLHIFNLEMYDTIVYIDADCLVVKDIIDPLLNLGKVYINEEEALIGACPDIFPPGYFNAGVMVIRPSSTVFNDMLQKRYTLLPSYDGGDTGFLNAYFPDWFTDMPPYSRLSYAFNAQRFMYHCTYDKQPNYWETIAPDLSIIHYSSSPKPWESSNIVNINNREEEEEEVKEGTKEQPVAAVREHLDEATSQTIQKVTKSSELEQLWNKWYKKSSNYYSKYLKEKKEEQDRDAKEEKEKKDKACTNSATTNNTKCHSNNNAVHKNVTKRYKQLRREGIDMKKAMDMARSENGLDKEDADCNQDPGSQVAAMFGMM